MKNIEIRKLIASDIEDYKNIRLELLMNEANSFGSSYDEESSFADSFWINRLTSSKITILGAFNQEDLVGIVLYVKNPRKKMKHIALVNSMYVKNNYKRQGIAYSLINEALKELKEANVEIVNLSVVTNNQAAIELYKKIGFSIYGEEKKGIKVDNLYINMYLMTLEL